MAYVNFPTYLETRSQGYGAEPQRPIVVAAPKQDDTPKTLLFLGIGLALGYFLLKSDKPQKHEQEKNPNEYIPIKSFSALMREFNQSLSGAKDGADGDKLLEKAIEKVRVKNPELDLAAPISDTVAQAAPESVSDENKKEKNPSDLYGGGSSLVIIKKVAKNKYYGIFKKVEHQHKRGQIRTKKTYSVELLDHKDRPIEDASNRFWLTSLPKAKAYVKELKGAQ